MVKEKDDCKQTTVKCLKKQPTLMLFRFLQITTYPPCLVSSKYFFSHVKKTIMSYYFYFFYPSLRQDFIMRTYPTSVAVWTSLGRTRSSRWMPCLGKPHSAPVLTSYPHGVMTIKRIKTVSFQEGQEWQHPALSLDNSQWSVYEKCPIVPQPFAQSMVKRPRRMLCVQLSLCNRFEAIHVRCGFSCMANFSFPSSWSCLPKICALIALCNTSTSVG